MDKDYLVLKRASASRSSGEWSDDDSDVLAGGVVVGRILNRRRPRGDAVALDAGLRPPRRSNAHYGYEPTREDAMAAFAKSWRRE